VISIDILINTQDTFLEVCPEATVGKILIQRNEETAEPMLFYSKLPPLEGKTVVVVSFLLYVNSKNDSYK
jgi:uracil phosphoribosyltransferase